jgi:low affinity Fe/Cu permease
VIDRAAAIAARGIGSVWALAAAAAITAVGRATGQWERVDALWTAASILLLIVLQRSTNAGADATHIKLDEIIRGEPGADDAKRGIEP